MTRRTALLIILGLVTLVWVASAVPSGEASGEWAAATGTPTPAFTGLSVHDARERSADEGRLLVLDFTATWCPPCRQMEATTWRDPRVLQWLDEHAVAVQVDVDRLPAVARAFGIRAMPTVIAARGEQEVGRVTGLKPAGELLAWLAREEAGVESLPEELLAGRVRYLNVPDEGSDNALARQLTAQNALAQGRDMDALADVAWLWAHGVEQQESYGPMRHSVLAVSMKTLASAHASARALFSEFLAAAQHEIDAGRVGLEVWVDWITLCDVLGEMERLEAWYQQHRDADGSLDAGRYGQCTWIADSLFARLVEQQRYAEAGRIYRAPLVPLERRAAMAEMLTQADAEGAMEALLRVAASGLGAAYEASLRESAARMSATLVAAGRDDEAIEVGRHLLARIDDGASRRALVERALEWAHPLPEHARWLAEAAELGEDVAALGPALEAGLRR